MTTNLIHYDEIPHELFLEIVRGIGHYSGYDPE